MGITLIMNKIRTIFKQTRIRGKQFVCKNMIVLYVVSDYSHVSRLDNPVSLQPTVDFNMSNSGIKHTQPENDNIKPVSEIISFLKFQKLNYFEKKEGVDIGL